LYVQSYKTEALKAIAIKYNQLISIVALGEVTHDI
jgi:hypothetical protein